MSSECNPQVLSIGSIQGYISLEQFHRKVYNSPNVLGNLHVSQDFQTIDVYKSPPPPPPPFVSITQEALTLNEAILL